MMQLCDPIRLDKPTGGAFWLRKDPLQKVLYHQDRQLTNHLSMNWADNPVQAFLCTSCWEIGCSKSGYINASRLGEYVLWSPPRLEDDEIETLDSDRYLALLKMDGPLLFNRSSWAAQLGEAAWESLPPTNRIDLAQAWLLDLYGFLTPPERGLILADLRGRLLATTSMSNEVALGHVQRLLDDGFANPLAPVQGSLAQAEAVGARVEVLHLEEPGQDWPALAVVNGQVTMAFGKGWVFVPADVTPN